MGSHGLGRRIVVVGSTGAGKTTLAEALSARLNIPHVELDSFYWEAGWAPASTLDFRARVAEALADDAWVVDGNYQSVRDLVLRRWCGWITTSPLLCGD
jgi:adenylate kinase family enzyme